MKVEQKVTQKEIANAVKEAYREALLELTEKHLDPKYALSLTQKNLQRNTGQTIPLQEIDRIIH